MIREKVTGKLLTLDRSLEPDLLPLLTVMGVEVEDREWNSQHPTQLRQRTLEAVKRLLLQESELQPLCLVFEDLHWVDSETQALLDYLVGSLPSARMLVMITYRPDYQHRWLSQSGYQQLNLTALPTESAEALLDSLLGDNVELASIKSLLINHTEGNPFFLEECVRTLFETKVLVRNGSTILLTNPPSSIQVPASVEAVLATRIDRLTSEQKRLLQCAAVVGKHVSHGLLQAVADMSEESLRLDLDYLQAAEFLYRTSLFPEVEYAFTHSLTHDVAYGSLLQERRRVLHARILEVLEAMSRVRPRSRSTGLPITRSTARSGAGRSNTSGRRVPRRPLARSTARRPPLSRRPLWPSRICPARLRRWRWGSTSVWIFGTASCC